MTKDLDLKGKRVLVAGLGVFGGGVASAKWFFSRGAKVTVTDMKSESELGSSLRQFNKKEKSGINFVLGEHRESDFKNCDILMLNPGFPRASKYVKIAIKNGVKLENVASVFFEYLENPIIAVTGTRGKSTTTSFIAELLSGVQGKTEAIGSSNTPLLSSFEILKKHPEKATAVELSSWQLESLGRHAPHIAVITNLYRDHQNRYRGMEDYAKAKANIFKYQKASDFLILNHDNPWTEFFLKQKPKSKVLYFSKKPLPKRKEGIFISKAGNLRLCLNGRERKLFSLEDFTRKYGEHNVENLLAAALAMYISVPKWEITKKKAMELHEVPYREEIIAKKGGLVIVNDSAATSPDATLSAISRFRKTTNKEDLFLITGGTDKDLEFRELAKLIKKSILSENLFLLEGSATKKLLEELAKISYFKTDEFQIFSNLSDILMLVSSSVKDRKKGTVVFSPGAASFEKFKNEFDRGEQFTALVKKYFKG